MSIRVRFVGIATSLLLALVSLTGPLAAPAMAGYTTLCWGYQGCSQLGMTASGYAQVNKTMYWRMYAGHNCTNYAAYRMIQSGMPSTRPWTGSGNAENWGLAMAHITDQTPRVGAIAWWKQNVWPAGSAGHVAYVEKVVSPTEIIVSQDSWGGDFSWARITKDGKGWPNGFVHFNDVTLTNAVPPTVTGDTRVGSVLTATPGSWSKPDVTVGYQWLLDGAPLVGATASTLELSTGHIGRAVSVAVTASKDGFASSTAMSLPTAAVLPGLLRADTAPALTGEAVVDRSLEVSAGSWYPAPTVTRHVWRADGTRLDEYTDEPVLPLGPELVDKTITVTTTVKRPGFEKTRVTTATSTPVAPGTLRATAPSSAAGTPRLGETLTVAPGRAKPTATTAVTWLRSGVPIEGATGTAYRITEADLGHRIQAQVSHSRPGYTALVQAPAASKRIRSIASASLELTPAKRRGRAKLLATVTAPGVPSASGVLRVKSAGAVLAEIPVVGGVARTTLTGLAPGRHRVRVIYTGSQLTTWAVARKAVRVR